MISASVCLSSQPDTAVQPAKEFCSYTTCWDTIATASIKSRLDEVATELLHIAPRQGNA